MDLRSRRPERLSATDLPNRPVLLTEIYPFARKRSRLGMDWVEIEIKLMLIMGREVTFAGSTLLKDAFIQRLFDRNIEFFSRGLIVPDLNSNCEGFEDRLAQYPGGNPKSQDRIRARRLDENVRRVISFEPDRVSSSYVQGLIVYLKKRLEDGSSKPGAERFEKLIEELRNTDGPLSLRRVSELCRLVPEWQQVSKMGEFLYCCTGAEVVGADALYSKHYKEAQVQFGLVEGVSQPDLELVAAESLFEFFAIDWRKLASLSPKSVLELRDDARIRHGVHALEKLVQEVRTKVAEGGSGGDGRLSIQNAADELRVRIEEACERQARRESILSSTSDAVYDMSGIPFSSLVKKSVAKLASWFAKSKTLGGVARPLTPLTSFASIIHDKLRGKHESNI